MMFTRVFFVSAIFASAATLAGTNTEPLENCYRACSEAAINDSLRSGDLLPEDEALARYIFEQMLQESLDATSTVCSQSEFQLMSEALCFDAEYGICSPSYGTKPIELPPFSFGSDNVPSELLDLIGNRKLSDECIDAFIL